jgi:two-component system, chemotaxis family, protein-glutamate methylesterase/glutaminase
MTQKRINVLIVDDSLAVRALLRKVLENENQIESLSTASNGRTALEFFNDKKPDVLILDMNMPEKNGLDVITEIRAKHHQTPVVLFSTAGQAPETLKALQFSQVDFLAKDDATESFGTSLDENVKKLKTRLLPKVFQFFNFKDPAVVAPPAPIEQAAKPVVPIKKTFSAQPFYRPEVVTIASSTGGPRALEELFENLGKFVEKDFGPMFIVQHMPAGFTLQLAERLSKISGLKVKEAVNSEIVQKSTVYIAPGNFHMELRTDPDTTTVRIVLHQKEQRHSVRPSADYLFETAAPIYKSRNLSLVLTGMGDDGIEGIPHGKSHYTKCSNMCSLRNAARS